MHLDARETGSERIAASRLAEVFLDKTLTVFFPTPFTPSMDAQAHPGTYPGKGLSVSQLIFALNEELKRSVYSPLYVAKYHREPHCRGLAGG